jgi:hypothetical protein
VAVVAVSLRRVSLYGVNRWCPDCGRWLVLVNGDGTADIAAEAELTASGTESAATVTDAVCLRCHPDDEDAT